MVRSSHTLNVAPLHRAKPDAGTLPTCSVECRFYCVSGSNMSLVRTVKVNDNKLLHYGETVCKYVCNMSAMFHHTTN